MKTEQADTFQYSDDSERVILNGVSYIPESRLKADRRAVVEGLLEEVEKEKEGSKENMEYQRDVTENDTNTKFWEGSQFGIEIIEKLLTSYLTALDKEELK